MGGYESIWESCLVVCPRSIRGEEGGVNSETKLGVLARTSQNPLVNTPPQEDILSLPISFQILQVLSKMILRDLIIRTSSTLGLTSSCYPLPHNLRVYPTKRPWSPTTVAGALFNPVCSLQKKGGAEGYLMGWTVKVETNGLK